MMTIEQNLESQKLSSENIARAHRPDVIEFFIQLGDELFKDINDVLKIPKEANVLHWLFFESQSRNYPLSYTEVQQISSSVIDNVSNVFRTSKTSANDLTVGQLKEAIKNLPDNTPVLYQRIEDSYFQTGGWKTYKFLWESYKVNYRQDVIDDLKNKQDEHYEIVEKNGQYIQRTFSNYISAFSAYSQKTDDGKIAFLINSHY